MTSFYTIQSAGDAHRLLTTGSPWPTAPSRSALGEGVYSFQYKSEASFYQVQLQKMGVKGTNMLEFKINIRSLKQVNVDKLANPEEFLSNYSKLWGGTPTNEYQYIMRGTNFGTEHYFNYSLFGQMKFK